MKHEKVDNYPYGLKECEINFLGSHEDVYDILETFDSLEDAFCYIKEVYGEESCEYAKKDAEQSISEEKDFIEYCRNNGKAEYVGYATFEIAYCSQPTFVWFESGTIARVVFF